VTTDAARANPRRRLGRPRPAKPRPPRARPPKVRPPKARNRPSRAASLFDPAIARRGAIQAFVKLDPRVMIRIPVMFLVEVGSVITTVDFIGHPSVFVGLVAAWLWATVLFANFAEAVAEGRGKAQADTLRRSRRETVAFRLTEHGTIETVPSRSSPATATSSRASPSSTSRPSPASRPRSSANPAATARR
jgi:hypothetical protein